MLGMPPDTHASTTPAVESILSRLTITARNVSGRRPRPWQLVRLADNTPDTRSAISWIVAQAIMQSRCGRSPVLEQWKTAVLSRTPLTGRERAGAIAFVEPVFSLPGRSAAADHLQGYIGEWLWYLTIREINENHRSIEHIEVPSWSTTESGLDGFIVYGMTENPAPEGGTTLIFRLWELKKHNTRSPVSHTVNKAYTQLKTRASTYLAKLVGANVDMHGRVGDFIAGVVDMWVRDSPQAGVGVGVTTSNAPTRCFTTMPAHFPNFTNPAQLEGMLIEINDFPEFAREVQRLIWTAL